MKYWRELPYRGDGESKTKKSRKRFVDLKRERRETAISILMVIIFSSVVFSCIIFSPTSNANSASKIGGIIAGSIFTLTLIAGILSINKFRKGYDVDVSDEAEKDDGQSEDSKGTN